MSELEALRRENAYLKQELAELKRLIFGKKSERFVAPDPSQISLFELESEEAPEARTEVIERKVSGSAQKPVRKELPAHLPRIERVLEPQGVDLANAVKIGEFITEYLNYVPARIFVDRIVRPKYKLADNSIVIADLEDAQPIAKSNVGAELLAHLLISKYCDHLPLYRIVKMLKRDGIDMAESTVNGWAQDGMKLLKPLFEHLQIKVNAAAYLQADETPIAVLESVKPGSTHKGYYWVYHAPNESIISFQYHKSRSGDAVKEHLKNFKGFLQSDGYAGYNQFDAHPDVQLLACMSHARRKFFVAKENDPERANQALELFGVLYQIEQQARQEHMNAEQRLKLRQEQSVAAMQDLKKWLQSQQTQVLPKSAIGEAILYTLRLWDRLMVFTENGELEIDNNLIENKIRPVALGRKNYLFAGSHDAATRAGSLYSFMAMCQLHDVNPLHWLTYVLKKINNHSIQQLDELLPKNWAAIQQMQQNQNM